MGRILLSLALPFYNEEENVTRVIRELEQAFAEEGLEDYEIMAVNNGSSDRTGELLEGLEEKNARIKIVTVPVNQGLGFGVLEGFRQAQGEYVGFNCGDGQIAAHDVVKVWRKLIQENLDLCKVKRVVRQDGFQRLFVSFVFNSLCHLLFGVRSMDINGIPKIMKREALERLELFSRDWFIDCELMIKATQQKLQIGEVEVEFLKRQGGSSHVNWKASQEFLKNLFIYRVKGWPSAPKKAILIQKASR